MKDLLSGMFRMLSDLCSLRIRMQNRKKTNEKPLYGLQEVQVRPRLLSTQTPPKPDASRKSRLPAEPRSSI